MYISSVEIMFRNLTDNGFLLYLCVNIDSADANRLLCVSLSLLRILPMEFAGHCVQLFQFSTCA